MIQSTNGSAQPQTQADWTDVDHTGPGTLAGRYLRMFWQPIYRSQDLDHGRAKPLRIMSEDFTLYRGEASPVPLPDGEATLPPPLPHLLAFRCAHRGTQLSAGWVEGDDLRCFYHGWKYDATGQCIEQPAEPEPFCQRIKIRVYPVEEYLGLIFVYLGDGEPPPFPRYPLFEEDGVRTATTYRRDCNYYNSIENGVDPVHVAFVHRVSAFTDNGLIDLPHVFGEETDYGVATHAQRPGGAVRTTHHMMPNILHIKGSPDDSETGWTDQIAWRIPIDDEHHVSYGIVLQHVEGEAAERLRQRPGRGADVSATVNEIAGDIMTGKIHVDEIGKPPYIVGVQDTIAQVGQGTLADRLHEHLGRSDVVISLIRRVWARELQALAEDRPLKRWALPERVEATIGV
ncbi:MAG: Rieske 2Fe-2S protein [Chloroflexi bacterium]|nr:Rieske 2Fe-2S protein [Chloroflexota bacterium]